MGVRPECLAGNADPGQSSIGVKDLDRNTLSKSALENNPNLPIFINMDNFETTIQKVYDMDLNRIESITILQRCGGDSVVRFSGSQWCGGHHDGSQIGGRLTTWLGQSQCLT